MAPLLRPVGTGSLLRAGMRTVGRAGERSFRPAITWISSPSPAGTRGAVALAYTTSPDTSRYCSSVVAKARSTTLAVDDTSMRRWLPRTVPTCRPRACSEATAERTVAAVAPKRVAKAPGRRYLRNSGDAGVATALAKLASPAGSRGRSATSRLIGRDTGRRPSLTAAGGSRGAEPTSTNRAAPACERAMVAAADIGDPIPADPARAARHAAPQTTAPVPHPRLWPRGEDPERVALSPSCIDRSLSSQRARASGA